MNRKNYLAYGHNQRVQDIWDNAVLPEVIDEPETINLVSPADVFIKLVYAPDPISKLPTGDLGFMVSDRANPEVKQWVLQNLQIDTSSAANLSAPKGLSDDDIIAMTRKSGESTAVYAERINAYFQQNKQLVNDALEAAAAAAAAAKQNVPDNSGTTSVPAE